MRLPRVSSTLQEVENSSYLVYFPFLGRKMVRYSSSCRASSTRLGEDMGSLGKKSLRLGEGGVRLSEGHLGEGVFA